MDGAVRPDLSTPNGLLAALVRFGVVHQPEVTLTKGLGWLLGLAGAAGALDGLISTAGGQVPESDGYWLAEVGQPDLTRTDLELHRGDPPVRHVIVEAKIGHTLEVGQLVHYQAMLDTGGLLAVLVPEARRFEAERIVELTREESGATNNVALAVWTWDDVVSALETQLPESPDVAQFRGLVTAFSALDIYPIGPDELLDDNRSRRDDIWKVVDAASWGLFSKHLPSGTDGSLEQRRFVEIVPFPAFITVGVGRKAPSPDGGPRPWAWLRIPDDASYNRAAQTAVEHRWPERVERDGEGLWLPLDLPVRCSGTVMTAAVREQIEMVATVVQPALHELVERAAAELADSDLSGWVTPVLGMAPIRDDQLLDSCPDRRADIEFILQQAVRSLVPGKLWPKTADGDYELNRYLPITPYGQAHIATSMGRRTQPVGVTSQPWAWIRVHRQTHHSQLGRAMLESLAPGSVVEDADGWAIPIVLPLDEYGPAMLRAARDQINAVVRGFRAAIAASITE